MAGQPPAGDGASARVAAFARTTDPGSSHADELERVLLDTIGSALAGAGTESQAAMERWAACEGGTGRATAWISGRRVSASQAALLNGTAAHALDWDDVSPGSATHPSAVLIPALLAMAGQAGANGPALAAAYDVGAATFRALAHVLPRAEHYRRGWHTTATVGRLAAVAALVNLCELEETQARHALGLAGSMAGGSLANFGTMTKPLHVGLAARDAVMAVQLAADGFTANPSQLEAPAGFFALFGDADSRDLEALPESLAHWRTAWPRDWALKRYPACYATHRAIDAALEIRNDLDGRVPCRVEVVTEPGGLRPLIDHEPMTGTEAKFSMPYVVAVALTRGAPRLGDFTDEALRDDRVHAAMNAVTVTEAARPPIGEPAYEDGFTVVTAHPSGGASHRVRVDHTYGDARRPLSRADIEAKFADGCGVRGLTSAEANRFAARLAGLPRDQNADCLREFLIADEGSSL